MSRSAESRAGRWPAVGAIVLLLGLAGGGSALAEPDTGVVRPQAAEPAAAPVLDIDAPVLDIVTATSDLGGTVKDEESTGQVKLTLDATVLFPKDSPRLTSRAREVLDRVIRRLRALGPHHVRIVGYTDDLGSAEHGLVLSRQRASAVAAVLRPALAGYEFAIEGKGEADPVVPNKDEASRRQNRRVEITVTRSR